MALIRIVILALALACVLAAPAAAQTANLSVSDATVTEGTGGAPPEASFTVTLTGPTLTVVPFSYATANVTASAADYTSTNKSHTFPVNLTGDPQTFEAKVPINPDALDEPDETFKLNLSTTDSSVMVTDPQGIGTITDDDNDAPTARVDVNPQQAFVGKVIEFNGARSSDPEGQPLQYSWDLDANGSFETPTGSESAIGFAFFTTGLQAVGLRVTDPGLKSGSATGFAFIFPPPAGFGRDTTPPSTKLFPVRRSLRLTLRRRGIRVRYGCSEACLIGGSVGVDRRTGRRIGLNGRNRTMGRAFSATTKAGSKVFTFKLSRPARRALAKVKQVRVNLRFKVRDAAFNVRVTNHRITLKR